MASEVGGVLVLLRLKAYEYFGPVRTQPRRLVLSLLQLGFLGVVGFSYGYFLAIVPGAAPVGGAAASASTALSLFIGVALLAALSGGVMVLPMELDFVLTSPVRPRAYLHASVLLQLAATQLSTLPVVPLMAAFALARHYPPYWLPLAVLGYEAFLLFTILMAQALGMVVMTSGRGAKAVVFGLLALFLLPLLSLVLPVFPRYQDLPLPSTLYVASLEALLGHPHPFPWAPWAFLGAVAAALGLHALACRLDVVPHLRPNVALGFGDTIHPGVARQRLGRGQGRIRRTRIDLRPQVGSIGALLLRLHFLRMARERGVLAVLLSFLLVVLVPTVLLGPSMAGAQVATSAVLYTALVGPMLTFAWNTTERPTLWIPLTAGPHGRAYFQALFAAFAAVSLALPLVLLLVSWPSAQPLAWRVAALPTIALASAGLAILMALVYPAPSMASPGLGPLGGLVVPVAGSYVVAIPALFAGVVLDALGLPVAALLFGAYTVALAVGLWYAIGAVARRARP